MKTSKRIFLFAFGVLFFVAQTANAQVTIGSELEPNAGALLDLKQDATSPGANSSKGFNLPRVALTSLSSLSPCAADNDANKKSHTGLTVYNTTSNTSFTSGAYVWNGSSWIPTKNKGRRVGPNLQNTGITEIEVGKSENVSSFVVPESGCYAVNTYVVCTRGSNINSYYSFHIVGNSYSYQVGSAFGTTAHTASWGIGVFRTYVDYLEAGTYYFRITSNAVKWIHNVSYITLVKLSD